MKDVMQSSVNIHILARSEDGDFSSKLDKQFQGFLHLLCADLS